MTDLQKFIELYQGFGIELKANENEKGHFIMMGEEPFCDGRMSLSDKFGGQQGFYSVIHFSKEGAFLSQEFYE